MSVLDDARRLLAAADHPCNEAECPWLSMPQIVAALEAADAVLRHGLRRHACPEDHDCPVRVLRRALRDDG